MLINNINYRTVWMQDTSVYMINQQLLPFKFEIFQSKNYVETANAIKTMVVRGAPAIGASGAYGLAQGALAYEENNFDDFKRYVNDAYKVLNSARPTANDLSYALNFVKSKMFVNWSISNSKMRAFELAREYADWSVEVCRKIGEYGNKLIKNNQNILTHCNAGALACVDFGTALSPIRIAHYNRKKIFVYVDETRPRNQGAYLTAWELAQEKINHAIIADNAAGFFMKSKKIDLVVVGADRIAMNGDVANKIGTYEKAVVAKENNIPFYVAAPLSTFDINSKTGDYIPIEERSEEEILYISGIDENKKIKKVRIAPEESTAKNPAFDVTPAKYISGIITEKGVIRPVMEEIEKFVLSKYQNEE
ncbi:S-methyl-5-thioribose-1-phosphate isomerase [Candidatus Woesearchaeota archaeon]|nr:S-methyl-5-thioribose-1-phosphate isomerase [Candidatus Woesearchaeota archaeon]